MKDDKVKTIPHSPMRRSTYDRQIANGVKPHNQRLTGVNNGELWMTWVGDEVIFKPVTETDRAFFKAFARFRKAAERKAAEEADL